jgi:hypothetical protein
LAAHIEIEEFVTPVSVEYAYGRAIKERDKHNLSFADVGLRAARARDPKLLKVLEQASNILHQMDEDQNKENRRTTHIHGETFMTTETKLWMEAYRMVDEGTPIEHLKWIYAAAAFLAGYQL